MISIVSDQQRVYAARQKLHQLKEKGFKFITTDEEGNSWVGSHSRGLEIEQAMGTRFLGQIDVNN